MAWLQTCEYVTDIELFHERDFWQHPGAFESRRRGDCEDFALWAWRKLAEVGVDAEFCVGRVICDDRPEIDRQHAWVVFRVDEAAFLFEPAARIRSRMIRPLADAMGEYVPHFAVNHRFDTNAFVGCASDSHRGQPEPTIRFARSDHVTGAGVGRVSLTLHLDSSGRLAAAPGTIRQPPRSHWSRSTSRRWPSLRRSPFLYTPCRWPPVPRT